MDGEYCEATDVEQAERAEKTANRSTYEVRPRLLRLARIFILLALVVVSGAGAGTEVIRCGREPRTNVTD